MKSTYCLLNRQNLRNAVNFCTNSWIGGSTIFALSSGQGKCGVAVVRITGPAAQNALQKMTNISTLQPRHALLRKICDPDSKEVIDKGLCLWFPAPHSFTGEDSVEFQVHGGSAVLASLMSALCKLNFRQALPGEFTRRAFYNNKLDLTEIEGLADLIDADTEQQRRQALLQAEGNLGKLYSKWRQELCQCMANIEAYIDFGEDDNIEADVLEKCNITLNSLVKEIKSHLSDDRKGEILRSGVKTVIIGEPNVGKSSLLNYLVQRNAAIVTPIAGTTRDIVELTVNISGYPVILADTAGLTTSTKDIVELEGIRRAKHHAKRADFVIVVADASSFKNSGKDLDEYIRSYINKLELQDLLTNSSAVSKNCVIVLNKIDLLNENDRKFIKDRQILGISCKMEEGLHDFVTSITEQFKIICGNPSSENPTISQERYRNHLIHCLEYLENYFETILRPQYDVVLASHEIRKAIGELGKITGHVSTEEILDIIFKSFCIGK